MQKTNRINLRTTAHAKALIKQASGMMGVSMSYFILQSAYHRATQIIANKQKITLSVDEWEQTTAMPSQTLHSSK